MTRRTERIQDLLRAEISDLIRREVQDPRIGLTTVTDVDVSPDLSHAVVKVSVLGDDVQRDDAIKGLRHAKGFRSPMLILHGVQDFRVPYGHALETYNVYKAMGKKARLVVFPDENHWVLKAKNSLFWYSEVFAWLERWLKPKRGRKR